MSIKKILSSSLVLAMMFSSINIPNTFANDSDSLVAFPGAEGGGMYSQGARASSNIEIYHVTNLNDSGTGSFRDAVSQGNRIIVFDVAGNIMLESDLQIRVSNLTILGQTAPGEGICVGGESVRFIECDNVILRYMRFRMGDNSVSEEDTLGVRKSKDFIIDHCSIEWSVDECLSAYENMNFTAQYCIISESLNNSVHGKGTHGYGGIWGGINASFHHNLISTHSARMPRIGSSATVSTYENTPDTDSLIDVRNNVFYNYRSTIGYGGENGTRVNFVNNYYKPSEYSSDNVNYYTPYGDKLSTTLYLSGNYIERNESFNNDNWSVMGEPVNWTKCENISDGIEVNGVLKANDEYIYNYPVTTASAIDIYSDVIENAGASTVRDYTDTRIVNDIINFTTPTGSNGSLGLIDTQEDVGGWNELYGIADNDTDADGIPDYWEESNGLNKNDSSDAILISDNGYTNIENYANNIVETTYNSIDKNELWLAMSSVEKLNGSDYFAELWSNVETAYAEGLNVLSNKKATKEEIDKVTQNLNNALNYLKEDKRTLLSAVIAKAEGLDKQLYTSDSYNRLLSELEFGKEVLKGEYDETAIVNCVEVINTAIDSLEESNRIKLAEIINKYSDYENDEWTSGSYGTFTNELNFAKEVYSDYEAGEAAYINRAESLVNAFNSLKPIYEAEKEVLDFESFEVGTYDKSMSYNGFNLNYEDSYSSDKYLIENENGNKVYINKSNSRYLSINKMFDSILTGVYSVEFDFKITNKNTNSNLLAFKASDYSTAFELRRTRGQIYFNNFSLDSVIADIADIVENEWYTVKVVCDIDNKLVDVYVNGKKILSNLGFTKNDITNIEFPTQTSAENDLYCDNISITKRIYNNVEKPDFIYGDADGDGLLNIADVTELLQKILNDSVIGIENKTDDYFKYVDVDDDGILNSADVAHVLQKVLNQNYKMPVEPEEDITEATTITTESTTETTTASENSTTTIETQIPEDRELNMDTFNIGELENPYNINGFTITNKIDENIVVVERPISFNGQSYNNAIDGNNNEIEFTINSTCKVMIVGSTDNWNVQFSIKGVLKNGESYIKNIFAEPVIGNTEYSACGIVSNLEAGTYTINCNDIMISNIKLYN